MLISGENVWQDRGQPLDSLLGSVLLQHSEEFLLHFRFIAQDLVNLMEIQQWCWRLGVV